MIGAVNDCDAGVRMVKALAERQPAKSGAQHDDVNLFVPTHALNLNQPKNMAMGRKVDVTDAEAATENPPEPTLRRCEYGLALSSSEENPDEDAQPESHAHGLIGMLANDAIRGPGTRQRLLLEAFAPGFNPRQRIFKLHAGGFGEVAATRLDQGLGILHEQGHILGQLFQRRIFRREILKIDFHKIWFPP